MADVRVQYKGGDQESIELKQRMNSLLLVSALTSKTINQQSLNKSVCQLFTTIKYRSDDYKINYQTLQRRKKRMIQMGITFPSFNQIKKNIRIKSNTKNQIVDSNQNYFYVKNLSVDNIQEYISKSVEYSIYDNILTIMTETDKIDDHHYQQAPVIRNQYKIEEYNHLISQIVTAGINDQRISAVEALRKFYKISKNQKWELIIKLFEGVNIQVSIPQVFKQLVVASSKLLQSKFNSKIPTKYRTFQNYVKDQGLWLFGDVTKNYIYYNKQGRPLWAMIYLLMRIGRNQKVLALAQQAQQHKFKTDFLAYSNKNNRLYQIQTTKKDIFLETIYCIFNKKSTFSQSIIQNDEDYIWISYKTVLEANYNNPVYFQNMQSKIIKHYEQNKSEESFINLIHVLAFDKLIQPNRFMDFDDSIHLGIFIHLIFSGEESILWNKEHRLQFLKKTVQYSQQLSMSNLQLAIDYLIITFDATYNNVPSILSKIANILIYSSNVQAFFKPNPTLDTKLQERIKISLCPSKQEYQKFIYDTMEKYTAISRDYLYPCKVYEQLMNNSNKSIQFLLNVLVKDILNKTTLDQEEVRQISDLVKKFQSKQQMLSEQQNRLLQFILITRCLKDIIVFDKPVSNEALFIKYSPLNQKETTFKSRQIIIDLNRTQYFGVFAEFLFYYLKVLQKYYEFQTDKYSQYIDAITCYRKYLMQFKATAPTKNKDKQFQMKLDLIEKELEKVFSSIS